MTPKDEEVDDIFKDQVKTREMVCNLTAEDWKGIESSLEKKLWDGYRVTKPRRYLHLSKPKILISDDTTCLESNNNVKLETYAKIEALQILAARGYQNPEQLPHLYQIALQKEIESENEMMGKNVIITCPKCGFNQFKIRKDKTRRLDIGRIGGKFVYEPILSCMKCGYSFHERELEGHAHQFFITP